MIARCFVDTNVILYAGSKDPADGMKRAAARTILSTEDVGFSAQVMQEFVAAAANKKRLGITEDEAMAVLRAMMGYPVLPMSGELVIRAVGIRNRYQLSYWDASIVAAAQDMGCEIIYSEDFNEGQEFAGVRVVNPFTAK
jgi:predicted nucleic acid-binding protein